jgi:hypothetical protein
MSPLPGIYASQISGHLWAPTGAYDALASITLSADTSSITFAGIPSTYKHLELRSSHKSTVSTWVNLTLNGDASNSNYAQHRLLGDGTSASAGNFTSGNQRYMFTSYPYWGNGVWSFLDYANTNKYKTVRGTSGFMSLSTTESEVNFISDLWMNTSAITSITLSIASTSFNAYTKFALYGVK